MRMPSDSPPRRRGSRVLSWVDDSHVAAVGVGRIMQMDLSTIKVLYRQSDCMSLWGVPYQMRPGQSPGDIRRAGNIGVCGSPLWTYLGGPGWWGNISREDQAVIEAFLAPIRRADLIPTGPEEWTDLADP